VAAPRPPPPPDRLQAHITKSGWSTRSREHDSTGVSPAHATVWTLAESGPPTKDFLPRWKVLALGNVGCSATGRTRREPSRVRRSIPFHGDGAGYTGRIRVSGVSAECKGSLASWSVCPTANGVSAGGIQIAGLRIGGGPGWDVRSEACGWSGRIMGDGRHGLLWTADRLGGPLTRTGRHGTGLLLW
jgi:hypothetical protein